MIAGAFFRSGLIESWGRGIAKIITACQAEGKPAPVFETSKSEMSVTFFDTEGQDKQEDSFIVSDGTINCTIKSESNDVRLLKAIISDPVITYDGLSALLSISRRTVSREMKRLQGDGRIKREGARKNGRWLVNPKSVED